MCIGLKHCMMLTVPDDTLRSKQVICKNLSDTTISDAPRPTFLYFPTVLPRPAEVLQKKTESDEARRLLERDLGEAGGQLRRLLPGGSLGEAPTHKSAQIFDKAAQGGARAGAKFSAAIDKLRRRRLLLGEDLGKLAKGGGDYSWRKPGGSSQRVAATTPGDVAGDAPRPCPDLRREIFPES